MKYPRAFRNTVLAHFEKTKKKVWTREEVAMKILELWWDLPKRTAPNKSKKKKRNLKRDPLRLPKMGVPLKDTSGGTGKTDRLGQTIPDE